ncbi:MAG: patatin-like phospholipase family protein [Alphaproteobacteria bacterium]|nr:patatin-like phospholipase family protein [Alphaproteobacteria bacterium]
MNDRAHSPRQQGVNRRVSLALQGGGSHGAFTWGVLDRLLEDRRLEFDCVSGTSAGAMNGAVLCSGHSTDGREGARAALRRFWQEVGEWGRWSPIQRTPYERLSGDWRIDDSPGFMLFDGLGRMLSPYQFNPMNINPLKLVLEKSIDFDALRYAAGIHLFVCATNVRNGKVKVWENRDISLPVLLASSCLPGLFQAVEVDGEHYWDGGYMGNPAIWPVVYESQSRDIVVVQINPIHRQELPRTALEIQDRLNEITFNASLMREMRAIHFVNRLIEAGKLDPREYRSNRIHLIAADQSLTDLHASSKLNAEPDFLEHLFAIGRRTAEAWLERHFDALGRSSTIDIPALYL